MQKLIFFPTKCNFTEYLVTWSAYYNRVDFVLLTKNWPQLTVITDGTIFTGTCWPQEGAQVGTVLVLKSGCLSVGM